MALTDSSGTDLVHDGEDSTTDQISRTIQRQTRRVQTAIQDRASTTRVSDTATGASYRDTTLERTVEETEGDDAADRLATRGIVETVIQNPDRQEQIAESLSATGATESFQRAVDQLGEGIGVGEGTMSGLGVIPDNAPALADLRDRLPTGWVGTAAAVGVAIVGAVGVASVIGGEG